MVELLETTGPDALLYRERADPVPDGGDVLVDLYAAGVAFPDVLISRGRYQQRPALPAVLGQEAAGIVRRAPTHSHLKEGDRVAVLSPQLGCFAESIALPSHLVLPIPDNITLEEAACLPINYLTAHFALKHRGHVQSGQQVLVHGAAGGVGSAALQIARAEGARVVAVVSTEEKFSVADRLGAQNVTLVDHFVSAVHEIAPEGVDLVVDPVGGERFTESVQVLARYGKVLVIGFAGGNIPSVKVNKLLFANTDVVGVGWGAVAAEPGFITDQWNDMQQHVLSGACRPLISEVLPLKQASDALRILENRKAVGKVVLRIRTESHRQ